MEKPNCINNCAACGKCNTNTTSDGADEKAAAEFYPETEGDIPEKDVAASEMPSSDEPADTESNDVEAPEGEQKPADPNEPIDAAVRQLITNVYNSVDYENIFKLLGQEDNYKKFDAYIMEMAEQDFKLPEGEEVKPWWSFLEDKPATIGQTAQVIEYFISMSLNVGIAAAKVVTSTLYDTLVYSQFHGVQRQHEMFAFELGRMRREVDRLHELHPNDPDDDDKAVPAEASDDDGRCDEEVPASPVVDDANKGGVPEDRDEVPNCVDGDRVPDHLQHQYR